MEGSEMSLGIPGHQPFPLSRFPGKVVSSLLLRLTPLLGCSDPSQTQSTMAKSPNTKPPNPAAYVNPFPLLSQLAQAFYHSHGKLTDRHQEQELAEEMRRPSRTSTGAQGHRLSSPGVSKVSPAAEADTVSLDGGHLVQS